MDQHVDIPPSFQYMYMFKTRGSNFWKCFSPNVPCRLRIRDDPSYLYIGHLYPLVICIEAYVLNWSVSTCIHIANFFGGGRWSEVWRRAGPGPALRASTPQINRPHWQSMQYEYMWMQINSIHMLQYKSRSRTQASNRHESVVGFNSGNRDVLI